MPWKALLVACAVAAVNWVFVIKVVGVSYGTYGWLTINGLYEATPTPTAVPPTATATQPPATATPTAPVGTPTHTPKIETGTQDCSDQIDNNGNGLIDCADPGCYDSEPCLKPAPALGPGGLGLAAVVLLIVGSVAIMLRRRPTE